MKYFTKKLGQAHPNCNDIHNCFYKNSVKTCHLYKITNVRKKVPLMRHWKATGMPLLKICKAEG